FVAESVEAVGWRRWCWRRCRTGRTTPRPPTGRSMSGCAGSTGMRWPGSTCGGRGRRRGGRPTSTRASEQDDLCQVIGWLADQPWSTGAVGMYGTSYSGFNSLQVAAERPPALKAVIAIYASDDRYTDDVHYTGGAVKLLDLVD